MHLHFIQVCVCLLLVAVNQSQSRIHINMYKFICTKLPFCLFEFGILRDFIGKMHANIGVVSLGESNMGEWN